MARRISATPSRRVDDQRVVSTATTLAIAGSRGTFSGKRCVLASLAQGVSRRDATDMRHHQNEEADRDGKSSSEGRYLELSHGSGRTLP
jgi:hypothetical protein